MLASEMPVPIPRSRTECMYVCMYACMYAGMHVCVYAYMYACMHTYMHVCMCMAFLHTCYDIPLQNAGVVCQEYQTTAVTLAQSSMIG